MPPIFCWLGEYIEVGLHWLSSQFKKGHQSLTSIPWEYLSLFPALSFSLIAWGIALFAVYISTKGGNMPNIDPNIFLTSSLIAGAVGFLFLILTMVLFIGKLFTKDPIKEGIEKIQNDIKDVAKKTDIDNLSIALNKFSETFQGDSQVKRKNKRKRKVGKRKITRT